MRSGDLGHFMINCPATASGNLLRSPVFNGAEVNIRAVYREFAKDALEAAETNRKHVVDHEHLFTVFELLVGKMPETKIKLGKRLGHQGLSVMPHTQGSKSVRGVGVNWQATSEQLAEWRAQIEEGEKARKDAESSSGRTPRERNTEVKDNDGTKR